MYTVDNRPSNAGEVFSIISIITGIVGLFVIGLLFGLIAIITGIIGVAINASQQIGYGKAIGGIVLGVIDMTAVLLFFSL
jgi:uncharacterized protein (DUF697 family)